eukprot:Lankesteria_metandrocarpae@DN5286_c0_g1_i1.p1
MSDLWQQAAGLTEVLKTSVAEKFSNAGGSSLAGSQHSAARAQLTASLSTNIAQSIATFRSAADDILEAAQKQQQKLVEAYSTAALVKVVPNLNVYVIPHRVLMKNASGESNNGTRASNQSTVPASTNVVDNLSQVLSGFSSTESILLVDVLLQPSSNSLDNSDTSCDTYSPNTTTTTTSGSSGGDGGVVSSKSSSGSKATAPPDGNQMFIVPADGCTQHKTVDAGQATVSNNRKPNELQTLLRRMHWNCLQFWDSSFGLSEDLLELDTVFSAPSLPRFATVLLAASEWLSLTRSNSVVVLCDEDFSRAATFLSVLLVFVAAVDNMSEALRFIWDAAETSIAAAVLYDPSYTFGHQGITIWPCQKNTIRRILAIMRGKREPESLQQLLCLRQIVIRGLRTRELRGVWEPCIEVYNRAKGFVYSSIESSDEHKSQPRWRIRHGDGCTVLQVENPENALRLAGEVSLCVFLRPLRNDLLSDGLSKEQEDEDLIHVLRAEVHCGFVPSSGCVELLTKDLDEFIVRRRTDSDGHCRNKQDTDDGLSVTIVFDHPKDAASPCSSISYLPVVEEVDLMDALRDRHEEFKLQNSTDPEGGLLLPPPYCAAGMCDKLSSALSADANDMNGGPVDIAANGDTKRGVLWRIAELPGFGAVHELLYACKKSLRLSMITNQQCAYSGGGTVVKHGRNDNSNIATHDAKYTTSKGRNLFATTDDNSTAAITRSDTEDQLSPDSIPLLIPFNSTTVQPPSSSNYYDTTGFLPVHTNTNNYQQTSFPKGDTLHNILNSYVKNDGNVPPSELVGLNRNTGINCGTGIDVSSLPQNDAHTVFIQNETPTVNGFDQKYTADRQTIGNAVRIATTGEKVATAKFNTVANTTGTDRIVDGALSFEAASSFASVPADSDDEDCVPDLVPYRSQG